MTKTKIAVPTGKRSTHNLSCQSITTTDLFKVQPVFCREVFKGDSFNIDMYNINRVDSLPVSSFVRINNRFDWIRVNMSQVWKPFDAFMTKAPYAFGYSNTIPSKVPFFSVMDLLRFFLIGIDSSGAITFLNNQVLTNVSPIETVQTIVSANDANIKIALDDYDAHQSDLVYVTTISGVDKVIGIVLSAVGRKMWSLLYSLGYRLPHFIMQVDDDSSYTTYKNNIGSFSGIEQSALPLMAYMSILTNYFVPTKYRDYLFVNSMSYLVSPIPHVGSYDPFNDMLSNDEIDFVSRCYRLVLNVYYGSDYFNDSLVQPYNMKVSSQLDLSPTGSNRVLAVKPATPGDTTPVVENAAGTNTAYVDEYILSMLKSVSSKSQINALTQNNMLASALQQFGYKPESSDMIPYHLKQINGEIVISPEVAQADTSSMGGVPLGYKAGSGEGSVKDESINFDFDSYGFLFCINSVSPDIMYTSGINRELLHIFSEDYFDPAYVNLGFQSIANGELLFDVPADASANPNQFNTENTFGFQNKYAEFGYRKDFLSGDFSINTLNNGLGAFHFNREFKDNSLLQLFNNEVFAVANFGMYGQTLQNQYDRIFNYTGGDLDHIQQWTYFKILAHRSIPANGEWTVGSDDDSNSVEGTGITDNLNA